MTRVAVVSPHLDDAVLSAWLVLAQNPEARVISCFAGTPPGSVSGTWDTATKFASAEQAVTARRREDTAALALTASEAVHLDLLDEQYRNGQDPPSRQLTDLLRTHLADAEEVWLPAGLGDNADHLLVRDAALVAIGRTGQRIWLYADLPYASEHAWPLEVTGAARNRMRHHLLPTLGWPKPEELWRATLSAAALGPGLDRQVVTRLTRPQFRAKITAVRCYTSQLEALGCGPKHRFREHRIFAYEVHWPLLR